MPEQLTKHPEVTLQVLRSAGAKCGEGAKQEILTQCPAARFCKLPGGELCVFGLSDASKMTQVSPAEWKALLQSLPGTKTSQGGTEALVASGGALMASAVAVAVISRAWKRKH